MILNTLPVYNEESILDASVRALYNFLNKELSEEWLIVIADNASTDKTQNIAKKLKASLPGVEYIRFSKKGRGGALRGTWEKYKDAADIFSYMDIDLASDIKDFPKLVQAVKNGSDIAFGSRFLVSSRVTRSAFRENLSTYYNFFLRWFLKTKFTDGQCGFKAVNRKVIQDIVPLIQDNHWFFDTELLAIAERKGYRLSEIPIRWVETRNKYRKSKVKIIPTVLDYLKKIWRLRKRLGKIDSSKI